jgi:NAD(P)-dependent dehydrogenase (short-subunit alcohol dehydrogenase family)
MAEITYGGKVAIVTGSGAGLGRLYALLLASKGARLVINDMCGSIPPVACSAGTTADGQYTQL